MPISNRSGFRHCSKNVDVTSRTAVYGPVRTVVWQGSVGDRRPYADLTRHSEVGRAGHLTRPEHVPLRQTVSAFPDL